MPSSFLTGWQHILESLHNKVCMQRRESSFQAGELERRPCKRATLLLVLLTVAGAVVVGMTHVTWPAPAASPPPAVMTRAESSALAAAGSTALGMPARPTAAPLPKFGSVPVSMEPLTEKRQLVASLKSTDNAGAQASTIAAGPQAVVPILMYHHVGEFPPNPDAVRRDLTVSPARFEEQLAYLRDQGYHSIRLHQLYEHLTAGSPLPPKPIILTFDDGYKDNFENVYPLLLRYNFTATFFIVCDFADTAPWDYMSWDQLREMHAHGMAIEDHTRGHADLRHRKPAFLQAEIGGCRDSIEAQIGERPRFFAYPSGKYDAAVINELRAEGFWGAVTTNQGIRHLADQLFELKRIRVRGRYTVADLEAVLARLLSGG